MTSKKDIVLLDKSAMCQKADIELVNIAKIGNLSIRTLDFM